MDDFERAVLITFSGAADPALKARAEAFLAEIARSPEVWKLCLERFSVTGYAEVKFWCLQTLQELIRSSYTAMPPSTRDLIKGALLTWVTRDCASAQVQLPPFLKNKVAQTLVAVLQHEYPSVWPGFFQDLLRAVFPGAQLAAAGTGGHMSGVLGAPAPAGAGGDGMVDMFCRILVSVDEDLVSLDIPRSQDESKLSMHVKDSMREHSVADVAAAWHLLVEAYAAKAPQLASFVLNTMQRYVPWIDISLAANDQFASLLQELVDTPGTPSVLRGAALDCLGEVLTKRMDAVPKLNLVQGMGIVPRSVGWAACLPRPPSLAPAAGGTAAGVPAGLEALAGAMEGDQELLLKMAKLLASLAGEVMDALKRVENGVISLTALGLGVSEEAAQEAGSAAQCASQLLEQLFPAVLSAFRSQVDEVALPLLPFMSAYVARLKALQKRNAGLAAAALAHVQAILEGIAGCLRYPSDSALSPYFGPLNPDGGTAAGPRAPQVAPSARFQVTGKGMLSPAAKEEQSEVEEKRRDVLVLYKNLSKTAYEQAIVFLGSALQQAIALPQAGAGGSAGGPGGGTAWAPAWQDVEVVLTLLYEVGEAGIEDMNKPDCGALAPLVTALVHACAAAADTDAPPTNHSATLGATTSNGPSTQQQQQQHAGSDNNGSANGNGATAAARAGRAAAALLSQTPGQAAAAAHALGIRQLPAAHHPLVALVVLELFVRYAKVLAQSPALLPPVLLTFVDVRGMDHPLEEVATRACYLFSRLSKTLRGPLRPYLGALMPCLTPVMGRVAATPLINTPANQASRDVASKAMAPANAVVDDRLYVFEAVGLLMGQEEVPAQEQAAALGALLQPLTAQMRNNLRSAPGGAAAGPGAPGMIIQSLEAIVRLSKGFKSDLLTRQRPQLGQMFAGVFEVALAIPREYQEHRLLRARFISCVHRLVEGLQGLLLPLLPSALEALVGYGPQGDAGDLTDVLTLVNQLVARFKEALAPLMEGLLPVVVSRVHALLGADWDWTGRSAAASSASTAILLGPPVLSSGGGAGGGAGQQGGVGMSGGTAAAAANGGMPPPAQSQNSVAMNSATSGVVATLEDAREKGELQRALYSLLHAVAHNGLSHTLLGRDPALALEPAMVALTRGAATHADPTVRRTCVQVYCRLISEWVSSGNAETIPGFKRYAMEHLGGEACILGVLQSQPPLEPRDGATLALLQDLAGALKLVYERCGEDFSLHLLQVVAPAAGLPPQLAEQLVAAVRQADVKELRDALRTLLVQARAAGGKA